MKKTEIYLPDEKVVLGKDLNLPLKKEFRRRIVDFYFNPFEFDLKVPKSKKVGEDSVKELVKDKSPYLVYKKDFCYTYNSIYFIQVPIENKTHKDGDIIDVLTNAPSNIKPLSIDNYIKGEFEKSQAIDIDEFLKYVYPCHRYQLNIQSGTMRAVVELNDKETHFNATELFKCLKALKSNGAKELFFNIYEGYSIIETDIKNLKLLFAPIITSSKSPKVEPFKLIENENTI